MGQMCEEDLRSTSSNVVFVGHHGEGKSTILNSTVFGYLDDNETYMRNFDAIKNKTYPLEAERQKEVQKSPFYKPTSNQGWLISQIRPEDIIARPQHTVKDLRAEVNRFSSFGGGGKMKKIGLLPSGNGIGRTTKDVFRLRYGAFFHVVEVFYQIPEVIEILKTTSEKIVKLKKKMNQNRSNRSKRMALQKELGAEQKKLEEFLEPLGDEKKKLVLDNPLISEKENGKEPEDGPSSNGEKEVTDVDWEWQKCLIDMPFPSDETQLCEIFEEEEFIGDVLVSHPPVEGVKMSVYTHYVAVQDFLSSPIFESRSTYRKEVFVYVPSASVRIAEAVDSPGVGVSKQIDAFRQEISYFFWK